MPAGSKFFVSFDYRASEEASGIGTQCQNEPGQYVFYNSIGTLDFTTDWQHFCGVMTVPADCNGEDGGGFNKDFRSIGFLLSFTDKSPTYYFDNIIVAPIEEGMVDIVRNGNLEKTDMSCFYAVEQYLNQDPIVPATVVNGKGTNNSRGIVAKSNQSGNIYNSMLFLRLPQDDAATVILGKGWRLPTSEEVSHLYDTYTTDEVCCRMRPTISNGVYGYQLIGTNGNSVFFPSTGRMQDNVLITWDNDTKMWCKDGAKSSALEVFSIDLLGVSHFWTVDRCEGLPIRPVKERGAAPDTVFLKLNVLDRNIAEAQKLVATINPGDYTAASYQALNSNHQRAIAMRAYVIEHDGLKEHLYLPAIYSKNQAN